MKALRWGYVFSGSVVMLFAGLIYGWSVYRSAILSEFPGWTASQFSLNFSLCMTCFCIGTLLCGALAKKVPARLMMVVAAVLILVGFCMTSHMRTLGGLYLGYGVFAGFGIGIVYNAVMSVTLKWFPDCSGLVSGILLMGFGFSAMLMGPLFTQIAQLFGWRRAFVILGVATAAVFVAGAFTMRSPPEADMAPVRRGGAPRRSGRGQPGTAAAQVLILGLFCLGSLPLGRWPGNQRALLRHGGGNPSGVRHIRRICRIRVKAACSGGALFRL